MHASAIGSGKEIMTETLFTSNKQVPWYLPFVRMEGLIASFTSGAAGGVFAPSLSAGASIGSMVAGWHHFSPQDTNILILAGMAGFLTGVTRTPFTSAILVLEMTNRHSIIFHLMLAGMIASLAALIIDRHSFYDHLKVNYLKKVLHEEAPAEQPTIPSTETKPPQAQ
jgi:H+/Cl- antiporter ClcA